MNKNNTSLLKDHQLANRYALATVDMQEVIRYLDCYDQISQLHDGDENSMWAKTCHGLMSAAIVTYCRPFSENYSTGYAAAKLRARALVSVKERRALHDLLIEKRNTFIAHADWNARSVEIALTGPVSLHVAFSKPNIWQGVDVKEFRQLADGCGKIAFSWYCHMCGPVWHQPAMCNGHNARPQATYALYARALAAPAVVRA